MLGNDYFYLRKKNGCYSYAINTGHVDIDIFSTRIQCMRPKKGEKSVCVILFEQKDFRANNDEIHSAFCTLN